MRALMVILAVACGRGSPEPSDAATTRAALEAIGYVEEGAAASATSGVVVYDRARAQPGTNLVISAHDYEAVLMDMDGATLHTWRLPDTERPTRAPRMEGFRRAVLLPDGGLLVVLSGSWLYRLDRASNLVWKSTRYYHHDAVVEADGTVHVLARRAVAVPRLGGATVFEDYVQVFDPRGKPLRELSLLAPLTRLVRPQLMERAREGVQDILHINSLQLLDATTAAQHPAFVPGAYLVSSRGLDLLAVIDPATEAVRWHQQGPWKAQHDPVVLPGGSLLVFDNHPPGPSRVLELTLPALTERWSWSGGADRTFYTECCGTVDRLANGNTMVVVTDEGVACEVAPDGAVVWEWHTPHRARGLIGRVSRLLDVVRLPPAAELGWLPVN